MSGICDTVDGRLHAEQVDLAGLAARGRHPFYCYSTARASRPPTGAFAAAFAGPAGEVSMPSRPTPTRPWSPPWRAWAPAPTWSPRASCAGRWPPACRPRRIVFAGVGKTAAEMAAGLEAGILQFNVESLPELERSPASPGSAGVRGAGRAAGQSRRRRPDPREDLHRQGGEQVRHRASPSLGRSPSPIPRPTLPGDPPEGPGRAHRLADDRSRPLSAPPSGGLVALYGAAIAREGLPSCGRLDFGGGLGIAYKGESSPPSRPMPTIVRQACDGDWTPSLPSSRGAAWWARPDVLVTRVLNTLKTAVPQPAFHGGRRGDERPDPAGMLYEAWHDIKPVQAPAAGSRALAARWTSSVRSASPPTPSPVERLACRRSRPRETCSRSSVNGRCL